MKLIYLGIYFPSFFLFIYSVILLIQKRIAKKLIVNRKKVSTESMTISNTFMKRFAFLFPSRAKKLVTENTIDIIPMRINFIGVFLTFIFFAKISKTHFESLMQVISCMKTITKHLKEYKLLY